MQPSDRMYAITSYMHRFSDQLLQERLGIGMSQYRILMLLAAHELGMHQRAIADALRQTEASVSRQIHVLREKLMIEQLRNPASRRERIVTITPKGIKLAHAAKEAVDHFEGLLLGVLDEKEQRHLHELLEKLATALK